jgi:hypothetical protein
MSQIGVRTYKESDSTRENTDTKDEEEAEEEKGKQKYSDRTIHDGKV